MAAAAQLAATVGMALVLILSWLPVLPFVARRATGIGVIVGPPVAPRVRPDTGG